MAKKIGKIICVTSTKGGTGKTTTVLNLAGIYSKMKKKVLVIDLDLYSGGIALCLDIKNKKDIFMLTDNLNNNRFTTFDEYVEKYNEYIDVLSAPRDPRQATKMDSKYLPLIFDRAKNAYDVVLVDTNHIIDEINLMTMDHAYMTLLIVTNDIVDLKNTKSIISIFKDADKTNYITLLNNSRDTGRDYLSTFDINNLINDTIDYTISNKFYIKNIDKYVLSGEILTLVTSINAKHRKDINVLKKLALDLIDIKHIEEAK